MLCAFTALALALALALPLPLALDLELGRVFSIGLELNSLLLLDSCLHKKKQSNKHKKTRKSNINPAYHTNKTNAWFLCIVCAMENKITKTKRFDIWH